MTNVVNSFFAQERPNSKWKTLYTAQGGEILYYVNVTNVSSGPSEWYLAIAQGNAKFGRSNALVWGEVLQDHDTDIWGYQIPLSAGMRVGVFSSVSGALNFTAYGMTQIA